MLDRAEQNLTNARSDSASAKAASLITRVDAPDTGASPVSPSELMIVLGGLLGGLLTGLGIVLLTAPAATAAKRRGSQRRRRGRCSAGASGGPAAFCRARAPKPETSPAPTGDPGA